MGYDRQHSVLTTDITYGSQPRRVVCDHKCEKAWGIASRPRAQLSGDPDDYAFLADGELGDAPANPGTYEGGEGKPMHPKRHNRWCVRACERSDWSHPSQSATPPDFSQRRFNMQHRQPGHE